MNALFETQRKKVLDAYQKAGQPFIASTQPLHSTRTVEFTVVGAQAGAPQPFAFAVARAGQELSFFDYGIGDSVDVLNGARATEAETNLASGKSTNGAADFVIEGVGFHARGMRIRTTDEWGAGGAAPVADPDVTAAIVDGDFGMYDPAAIVLPPQAQSPFNLENGMFQALLGLLTLEFEWDRKRTEPLGVVDLLPQAGAQSYLRANGVPSSENRYRIPEGYLWRRDGQPDSEFVARVRLARPLIVPISLVTAPEALNPNVPQAIFVDVVMRLFGLEVDLPSAN